MSPPGLSPLTRRALLSASGVCTAHLVELQRMQQRLQEGQLGHIWRFDVGSNTDPFPSARDVFDSGFLAEMLVTYLREYPDNRSA